MAMILYKKPETIIISSFAANHLLVDYGTGKGEAKKNFHHEENWEPVADDNISTWPQSKNPWND